MTHKCLVCGADEDETCKLAAFGTICYRNLQKEAVVTEVPEEQPREHWSKRHPGPIGIQVRQCPDCGLVPIGQPCLDPGRSTCLLDAKPCRSPYCECEQGQCTHPGSYDARGTATDNPMQALLDEAASAVVARGKRYGEPEDNFARIARLWTAHLANRYADDTKFHLGPPPLDTADVAIMMILLKTARLANDPTHRDSWVDIAGYAAGGGTAKKAIDTPS